MKTIKLIPLLSILMLLTQNCERRSVWGIRGSGPNVSEKRLVLPFDRIQLSNDTELSFTQDSVFSLEVIGQANILAVLETKVNGSELFVSFRRSVWDHNRVKVIVHAPAVTGLSVSGSGTIVLENLLKTESLNLDVSGSGYITIPGLSAAHLDAQVSGSGSIKITSGTVFSEDLDMSGSGQINLEYLICSANVSHISGSGLATVNVTENLKVNISGSGVLKFRGNPTIQSQISGSGKLIHIN